MDGPRFDSLSRVVGAASGRRAVLKATLGGAGALLLARPDDAGAALCKYANGTCASTANCCNQLVCQKRGKCRKKGNKKLTGKCKCGCPAGAESCAVGADQHICVLAVKDCRCHTGAGNVTICGALEDSDCSVCTTNADCAAITGPGSICLTATGNYFCTNGSTTGCMPPCGNNRARTTGTSTGGVPMTRR